MCSGNRFAVLTSAALLLSPVLSAVELPVRLFEIPVKRFIVDESFREAAAGIHDPLTR